MFDSQEFPQDRPHDLKKKNKGGFAAEAALRMISIRDEMKATNV